MDKVLKCENHTLDDRVIDVKQAIPHAQHQVKSQFHDPFLPLCPVVGGALTIVHWSSPAGNKEQDKENICGRGSN